MTTQEILEAARAARSALGLSSGEVRRAALLEAGKARVLPQPGQLHRAQRAVALLGDDHLGGVGFLARLVIIRLAVQEHDHVRVLLDALRAEHIGELCEAHDGHIVAQAVLFGQLAQRRQIALCERVV